MPCPRSTVPHYRHFKPRDLAYVVVDGRKVYLGRHGSTESRENYARIAREVVSGKPVDNVALPKVDASSITVAGVLAAFWTHARTTKPYDPIHEDELAQRNADLETLRTKLEEKQFELEATNAKLDTLATLDGLTWIANRRKF